MAPKKKQQQQKQKQKTSSSSSSKGTTTSSTGPKLQISVENENRLRRLLLNSGRSTPASVSATADDSLSKEQKAKRLRSVYEKLSCEGFRDDQIELALSILKESATFEAALDWLCLNLRGHELPTKFSSGTSLYESGGSIGVISTARNDWVSSRDPPAIILEDKKPQVAAKPKGRNDGETLDSLQPSQADWIRQYMEQQEEDEYDSWEDNRIENDLPRKVLRPRSNPESILEEYNSARMEAINAKERGDKKGQEQAGLTIRRLKQEIFALGLSDDILASAHVSSSYRASKDTSFESKPSENFDNDKVAPNDIEGSLASMEFEAKGDRNMEDNSGTHEHPTENVTLSASKHDGTALEGESGDVELGGLFVEDDTSGEVPLDLLELQKKEKLKELSSGKNLKKLEGIWRKGDPPKVPKAFLQQLCQRAGWEAPKYDKVTGRGRSSSYSVSILQKASGRGKSRKVGGLTNVLLPHQDETFDTAEDAQNKVAAYALHSLFPDLPVHLALMEPYASVVLKWKEEELFTNVKENKEDRRAGFVDSLLSADRSESNVLTDVIDSPLQEKAQEPCIAEGIGGGFDQNAERINQDKGAESSYMKKAQERKKEMGRYKEMLETRSRLPIFEKKGDILHLLEENNVLVICGETGCGKTTQVPQYILDDMIEAGRGGYCNIICTQPRRIAATSVAERVADERCEPSPGSNNSLVGYQVRLDSARNERTKLLFCTTGILLRMISGDKDLDGVSHVIVDEVHERSLLGDFLLTVMKNLIEKQSRQCKSKLKLILMSATVDSHMFSRYFDYCPVITAQGRTHPVSTHYLEDVYETLEYRLASDSPACINNGISGTEKSAPVGNHRGKKNLVLASWGDDSVLSEEYINPFYDPSNYQNYHEQTRQNLRRVNEDIIDYDLLEDLICHIDETYAEGAILVFLPGVPEINLLLDKLAACHQFGGLASEWLLPLHSSVASEDQKKVFQKAPDNIRKVIIATNIAETSITIDDVVYVIDCGKHKENRYNPQKKLSSMVEDWISRANVRQRRGRAGRVKPGICFCLYTRHRYEKLMRPYQMPEMMRMPLVELCLQVKLLSLGSIKQFLSKALEPPREEAISSAISSLYEVGAIDGDEELTSLGYHLAKLPVDVLIGKMMLYGGIFGCLSPILTISAFLSHKSPFVYPKDERENVERAKLALATNKIGDVTIQIDGIRQSDHLIMMIAYQKWDKILREHGTKAAHRFCSSHFLSSSVMFMIREMRIQLGTLLADIGIITTPKNYKVGWKKNEKLDNWLSDSSQQFNKYSCHFPVVKAILCAGLYPNIAMIEGGSSEGRPVWYDGKREVHIHPSSVNSSQKAFQYPFIVFLEKVETTKVFLRDTTVVSPYSILLFGGSINVQHQSGLIDVDDWLKMAAPAQTAVLFKELRSTLHSILKELIRNPQKSAVVDNEVIRSIIQLFLEEDKPTR